MVDISPIQTIFQALVEAVNNLNETIQDKPPNWVGVPATAASAGTAGQMAYQSGFLYVCVATNTWQRVAIATF